MNDFFNELNISLVAIVVSVISIVVAWRTYSKTVVWQREDITMRRQAEERQKLEPYVELVHKMYCSFDKLFSNYSTEANSFFSSIVDLADTYNNGNGTNEMALRHHMTDSVYKIIEKINEEILFQHPEYLFNNLLNHKYRKIDYKLDLQKKSKLNPIEYNLKILHENMNPKEKKLYVEEVIKRSEKVHNIYKNNSVRIEEAITELENAMIKYQNYDFDRVITKFYLDFKGLLNLLLYIREVSTTYTREFEEDFYYLTLSEVLYKITSIMIVNEGVLKLHKSS